MSKYIRINLIFVFIIGLCLAIYFPGLYGQIILDDQNNLAPVLEWWHGRVGFYDVLFGNKSGRFGRVVSMASFMLNWHLFGDSIFWLKAFNLIIHVANGILVLFLARESFVALGYEKNNCEKWALFVASAWLLSPMFVSTTLYIVQRMAQLSAFFIFLGMYAYARMRRAQIAGDRAGKWFALVLLSWMLAIFSKENGVLLLPLVFVQELSLYRFVATNLVRRSLLIFFLLALIVPLILVVGYNSYCGGCLIGSYETRNFTLTQRIYTQLHIVPTYFVRLLFPNNAGFGVFQDDFPVSNGWFAPVETFLGGFSILAAFLFACWKALKGKSLFAFGVFVFLVGHSLESTVFPLELYFEHRNYMPGVGVFMLFAGGFRLVEGYSSKLARYVPWIACFWLVLMAFIAWNQAQVWRSHQSIVLFSQKYHPGSLRLNSELVQMYTEAGKYSLAIEMQERIFFDSLPYYRPGAGLQLAYIYCRSGRALPNKIVENFVFPENGRFNWPYFTAGVEIVYSEIAAGKCVLPNLGTFIEKWLDLSRLSRAPVNIASPAWSSLYRGAEMAWWRLRDPLLAMKFINAMDSFPGYSRRGARGDLLEFDLALALGDVEKAKVKYQDVLRSKSSLSVSDVNYFEARSVDYKKLLVRK